MPSNTNQQEAMPIPVKEPINVKELAALLIKHYDLHEGRYDLAVEFQIGAGLVGPNESAQVPGAMIGVSKFALIPTKNSADGPTTVDAAIINPAKKKKIK